jgi:hypothetical protein
MSENRSAVGGKDNMIVEGDGVVSESTTMRFVSLVVKDKVTTRITTKRESIPRTVIRRRSASRWSSRSTRTAWAVTGGVIVG